MPQPSLLSPDWHSHDRSQIPLGDRIASVLDGRKKEDGFLNVRGKMEQVHDLRHPRPCDMSQSRKLCEVGDNAITNQIVKPDCQRHQIGHPWHTARHRMRLFA